MPHPTYLLPRFDNIFLTTLRLGKSQTQRVTTREKTLSGFVEDRWLGGRGGRGVKTSKHKQGEIGYLGDAIVGDRPCHRDGCAHPAGHLERVWKVWNFQVKGVELDFCALTLPGQGLPLLWDPNLIL